MTPVLRPDFEQGVPPGHTDNGRRGADATPVFVDESGRRHTGLRATALGAGSVVGGFGVVLLVALLSGLVGEPNGGWACRTRR